MSCDSLLEDIQGRFENIQTRLSAAEGLLLQATPETVTASAGELSEAVAGMTALMDQMESGRPIWTDRQKGQFRTSVGKAKWRLSRCSGPRLPAPSAWPRPALRWQRRGAIPMPGRTSAATRPVLAARGRNTSTATG